MNRTLRRAWLLSLGLHALLLALLLTVVFPITRPPVGSPIQVRMWRVLPQHPLLRRALLPSRRMHSDSADTPSASAPVTGFTVVALPVSTAATLLSFGSIPPHLNDSLTYMGESMKAPKQVSVLQRSLNRPASQNRVHMVRPRPTLQLRSDNPEQLELPLSPLERIALSVVYEGNGALDMVFLIDASQSMEDNIRAVARHLNGLIFQLEQGGIDARLGVVAFRHSRFFSVMGWDIEFQPLTRDFGQVKRMIQNIECLGGERALDAILIALKRVEFRKDASRRMILVTDEYLSGEVPPSEVLRAIRQRHVKLDVIGRDEPSQRYLADASKGIWQSIEAVGR